MASKYWIKLYHEILDDEKVMFLRPALRWRFIEALLVAGERDENGLLPDPRKYAWRVRDNYEQAETELNELAEAGLLTRDGGQWYVTKFAERQKKVSGAERVARYRERQKKQEYYADDTGEERGGNVSVTKGYTDTDTDTDTDERECAPAEALRIAITGEGRTMGEDDVWRSICDLVDGYCGKYRATPPDLADARRIDANREKWVIPGDTLMRLVDDDYDAAAQLMLDAAAQLDKAGYSHSSLGSLVSAARSIRFKQASENGDGRKAMLDRVLAYRDRRLEWGDCTAAEQAMLRRITAPGGPEDLRNLKRWTEDKTRIAYYALAKEAA